MIRGLMWFPLLGIFIWLARAGYIEYQKLETYKQWAVGFDRCKYDIYAVIGLKGREISWGRPTKVGPIDLQTFSLDRVSKIQLSIDSNLIDLDNLPDRGKQIQLQFQFKDEAEIVNIPFTEIPLAAEWARGLNSAFAAN
jgi:hypothetical protein